MERGEGSDPKFLPLKDFLPEPLLQDLLLVGFLIEGSFAHPRTALGLGIVRGLIFQGLDPQGYWWIQGLSSCPTCWGLGKQQTNLPRSSPSVILDPFP